MSVSKKIVGACGFLLVAAFAVTASAQSQHIQLYQIQVKSGSEAEFTAFIKKLVEAADKTESSMEWLTAQGILGTAGTNYYIFMDFDSWSERDAWVEAPQLLAEAFGEAEARKIMKMGGESMWNFESTVFDLDEERSRSDDQSRDVVASVAWTVESLSDLPANKLTCILSCSEPRDLVDLYFLDRSKRMRESIPACSRGFCPAFLLNQCRRCSSR